MKLFAQYLWPILLAAVDVVLASPDPADRRIVPVAEYLHIAPAAGGATERSIVTLSRAELTRLTIRFNRSNLTEEDGVQFVRITAAITRQDGVMVDKLVEKAFTFARIPHADDAARLRDYAKGINPLGFASLRKIDSVEIDLEELPDWATVEVRVEPDDDFAAYGHHRGNRVTWHYRVRGGRIDGAFYLGIPKVLYDSRAQGGLDYGRTSAMYRLFWLDAESGERFPVNVGMGVFGVRTPIDVSSTGGGFALSGLLDVFDLARRFGLELTNKVNAGIEVVPFFPVKEPARLLVALRVGIAP